MVVRKFGCDFTDTSSGQAKMSKLFGIKIKYYRLSVN
jgi:hypothetical protein